MSDGSSCVWIAARAASLTLSAPLAEVARMRVFDTLGALAVGRQVGASRALAQVAAGLMPAGSAPGSPLEVVSLSATARSTEVDDIDRRSCTTPGPVAVIVALVVAESRGLGAEEVLAGVVAGYEAMVRLGMAIDGPNVLRRGIWPSHLGAPLAAAAAAARTLGLDEQRTAHALAIAATRSIGAAGRIAQEPTSRWLTFGLAAADGVLAALAAEQGMVGALDALDVALPAASSVEFDGERFRASLGTRGRPVGPEAGAASEASRGDASSAAAAAAVDGPGLWAIERVDVKPFPTARQTQAAVEAARLAFFDGLGGGELPASVEVAIPHQYRAMVDQPRVGGRMPSLMSAQFQVAAALSDEDVLYDVVREPPAIAPATELLMARVRVVSDAALTAEYPERWPARVTVRAADGREAVREVLDPAGAAERPFGWEELERKHRRLGAWDGLQQELKRWRALAAGLRPAEEIT